MRYFGIDFGTARVGLALSDEEGRIAFPYEVLRNDEKLFVRLRAIAVKKGVGLFVVGFPRALSGIETAMTKQVRAFIAALQAHGFKTAEENELFSTKIVGRNAPRVLRDASSAALILQQYLDRKNMK